MELQLFRIVLPVQDIEKAVLFYRPIFGIDGKRGSPGRHYFVLGTVVLVLYDSIADGDLTQIPPNPEHIYISTSNLEATFETAKLQNPLAISPEIKKMPWGERSFYFIDPFGNKLCFVQKGTEFLGN